ncbi:MAG: chemotaxis protein CheW, partial [Dechloromonas agitata]|nr:chemotaxis protein CheW [Dechloromonas agitata]
MARKTSLRDFQEYLAARLSQAAMGQGAASWLGVEAGGEAWLVDLSDGGEVVQTTQLTPVPLT